MQERVPIVETSLEENDDLYWGICVSTPTMKCNCDFALYYSQVNAILPLVNGQNRGQMRKDQGQNRIDL